MGIVRHGAQQRPYHSFVQGKVAFAVYTVAQYDRDGFTAHFNVVGVGKVVLDVPDDTAVFLISLKAGGTGLNLTAAEAVIHVDPWWNVSAQNQATDRAHRIGQNANVQVYRMIMKDSIEEKIVKMQEHKKDLADSFIEGNDGSLAKMSKEEIIELFQR